MAAKGITPAQVFSAIYAGEEEFVAAALRDNRDMFVTKGWTTWLSSAASAGRLRLVQLLVEAGADMNAPESEASVPSPEGVIDSAAGNGHLEVVRWLLDRGAKINHVVDGVTRCFALVNAVGSGHLDVVRVLVERGAAVNSCWAGLTPLDHARMYGQDEVAAYLQSVGGKTAAELGKAGA
jgi:ankyrin repeat protein